MLYSLDSWFPGSQIVPDCLRKQSEVATPSSISCQTQALSWYDKLIFSLFIWLRAHLHEACLWLVVTCATYQLLGSPVDAEVCERRLFWKSNPRPQNQCERYFHSETMRKQQSVNDLYVVNNHDDVGVGGNLSWVHFCNISLGQWGTREGATHASATYRTTDPIVSAL